MDEMIQLAVERIRATAQPARPERDKVLVKCHHPAMARATITVVGGHYCVGAWYCPICGLAVPDTATP